MDINDTRMSPEEIKQTSDILSEVNVLMQKQIELISKALQGEKIIGETRIGYLKEYNDIYSESLDNVTTKQSMLGKELLILKKEAEKTFGKQVINVEYDLEGLEELSELTEEQIEDLAAFSSAEINKIEELLKKTEEQRNNSIEEARTAYDEAGNIIKTFDAYDRQRVERQLKDIAKLKEAEKEAVDSKIRIYNLMNEDEITKENRRQVSRMNHLKEYQDATEEYLESRNALEAEFEFAKRDPETAGNYRAKASEAERKSEAIRMLEEERDARRAELELSAREKNDNKELTEKDSARIEKMLAEEFGDNLEEHLERLRKEQHKKEVDEKKAANTKAIQDAMSLEKGASLKERMAALKELSKDPETGETSLKNSLKVAVVAMSSLAKQLEDKMNTIASYKGDVDTRLQGSKSDQHMGSYWDKIVHDMTSIGAVNPFFKQETFANNIKTLVESGIAFDLEQRAFLMTVQNKIANTFDVTHATLLRLVRIQQEDSTAGRLGMESALTAFLNSMYKTSEYMTEAAKSVKSSLEEMSALMSGAEATEVEFQVQKWLGSLYSVGMSSDAVSAISNALGQIAAGQIEGLTGGGAGNLLVMAANDAGLSIADILTDGINSSDTNKLLQAAVNYLAELSDSAADNKVVQQQLANVFGVKASDLRAATNLATGPTMKNVYGTSMTYDNMLKRLNKMAGSMGSRTSMAEMLTNIWDNLQYSMAGSMASNPVSYVMYNIATLLDDLAGGGPPIPDILGMGTGVMLHTTMADLMRALSMGVGILGSAGSLISGLTGSFSGQLMLKKLGIKSGSGLEVVPRGEGISLTSGGGEQTNSSSGYVGNSSGSDVKNATLQSAKDEKKKSMIEAKEEEEPNQIHMINNTVLKIYELLDDVTSGKSRFRVQVDGYGLTKAGGNGVQGGVGALSNSSSGISSSGPGGSSSGGGGNSFGGSVDFGSWTTT